MKFNFMKSKIFVVLSILLFVEILFCITGCKDLLISQNAAKTSININLDLSKLIKTSRNQTSQEVTEYLLKIEAYNAENYQENAEVENLPLLTQAKSKVDVSGLVKVTLEVPIDSNVILVAKLHKIIDENTESEKPLYKGKSEIFKVKESDNKIHLVLTKTNSDLDIDISLNTQSTYKVEHYKQNIEDDNYTLVESDSENKTGTIGTNTEAVAKSYEGFSVNPFEQKPILADGSTTVKIYYTRNVYTVIFNANGGSLKDDTSQKVKYGETPAEPTPPEKEGYNFGYWYTSKDNGVTEDVSYNFSTPVTNDVTLYAMWIAGSDIVYKVEHYKQNIEDDNYTLVESDSENKTGTIGTNTEAVAKSYEGFSVNPFEQKPILADGSTTVKIYYTRNVYTVTFNANGGSLVETQIIKYEGNVTTPTKPTKDGFVFEGWYTSFDAGSSLDTKFDFITSITSDVTLFAKWWDNSNFVLIPAGTFFMGTNADIATQNDNYLDRHKPVHEVTITKPFYMGKYEITQSEWKSIMGNNPSYHQGDNAFPADGEVQEKRPVENICWYDTLIYCNKRSMQENLTPYYSINGSSDPDEWGTVPTESDDTWNEVVCNWDANGYRLPTEAEWEYAARAGDNTIDALIYGGTSDLSVLGDYAWYYENSDNKTHEVGKKLPNNFGLYDMSGNVWEWCWNWFTTEYDVEFEGGDNPTGLPEPTTVLDTPWRIVRGESYCDLKFNGIIRRGSNEACFIYQNNGFRIVRTITE